MGYLLQNGEHMPKSQYPSNPEIREWGRNKFGEDAVPAAGRLPKWLIEAWNKTHRVRKYVPEQAFHGTPNGYLYHRCRQACCREAWNAASRGESGSQAA